MNGSNIRDNAVAAMAEDEVSAGRISGAGDGRGARENAASKTAREESPMRDKNSMNSMTADYRLVRTVDEAEEYIRDSCEVSFDLESAPDDQYRGENRVALDPTKAHIVGCSFSVSEGTGIYVPVEHLNVENVDKEEFFSFLRDFLTNKNIVKIAHNIAFESAMTYAKLGVVIQEPVYDTICAAQLTLKNDYDFRTLGESGLKKLAYDICGEKLPTFGETTAGKHFDELDPNDTETVRYAAADSDFALRLYHRYNEWFDTYLPKHKHIVEHVESPAAVYIGLMKVNGLDVDIALMNQCSEKAEAEMKRLHDEIQKMTGEVNIGRSGNTKTFRKYLFEDKKLPVVKLTEKGEPALDEEALILLQEHCESDKADREQSALSALFPLLREYRSWGKIKSTYIDGYLKHINSATGRIHPNMLSLSTETGRMSCSSPNAQNMPRKDNDPVGVRKFIKAPNGEMLLGADYSQVEMRVGAQYCRDPKMIEIFRNNGDIHAMTTSILYGVSYDEARNKHDPKYKERRSIAKNVNFGIFYGLYPHGLWRTLKFNAGITKTETECAEIIDSIKRGYKKLSSWQNATKYKATRNGYTETRLGRRRYLPDIKSDDWWKRSSAERKALNTPIQGTAADTIKLAMARILKGLPSRPWLKPILQIHDELLFAAPEDSVREAADFIRGCMEAVPFEDFDIPLKVEVAVGKNYGEMEELED